VLAWLSGSTLVFNYVVAVRRARLITGWVTVCWWVNHLRITSHLGQLSLPSLWGTLIKYQPFWLGLGWARSPVSGGR